MKNGGGCRIGWGDVKQKGGGDEEWVGVGFVSIPRLLILNEVITLKISLFHHYADLNNLSLRWIILINTTKQYFLRNVQP